MTKTPPPYGDGFNPNLENTFKMNVIFKIDPDKKRPDGTHIKFNQQRARQGLETLLRDNFSNNIINLSANAQSGEPNRRNVTDRLSLVIEVAYDPNIDANALAGSMKSEINSWALENRHSCMNISVEKGGLSKG